MSFCADRKGRAVSLGHPTFVNKQLLKASLSLPPEKEAHSHWLGNSWLFQNTVGICGFKSCILPSPQKSRLCRLTEDGIASRAMCCSLFGCMLRCCAKMDTQVSLLLAVWKKYNIWSINLAKIWHDLDAQISRKPSKLVWGKNGHRIPYLSI